MKSLIILLGVLSSTMALAKDYYLFEPTRVSIETYEYQSFHDPYVAPDDKNIGHGATFNTDLDVFKYKGYGLSWENELHFDQEDTTGQVRHAGWHYKLGLTFMKFDSGVRLEATREHWSRHVFDRERPMHFPVYDRTGIQIILYERPSGREFK